MNEEEKNVQEQRTGLDEKRKTALLRYIAILFAVAFILVLLSLFSQMKSSQSTISQLSQSSTSALENVEKLQEQNRLLQEENQTLRDSLSASEQSNLHTKQAYEDLLMAMENSDGGQEGNVTLSRALENLKNLKKHLGQNGLKAYENLMEEGE